MLQEVFDFKKFKEKMIREQKNRVMKMKEIKEEIRINQ
jgi:hypothetical protein